MINCLGWTKDISTESISESNMSTGFSNGPTSFTKRNWSISSSKDSREEAISFSATIDATRGTCCKGTTSWGGICWTGSLTRGRSSWAKKVGLGTSMRFILGSLALIAWPISWKLSKWARNPKSGGQLVVDGPRSRKFPTIVDNLIPLCWCGWAEDLPISYLQ